MHEQVVNAGNLVERILEICYPTQDREALMDRQALREKLQGKTFNELREIKDHCERDNSWIPS